MLLLLRNATRMSSKLMKEILPNVVVSVGGYGSLAPMQAAKKLGIQRVVVSYDSQPGLATKRQARDAHLVTKSHPHSPLSTATLVYLEYRFINLWSLSWEGRLAQRY
jgi:UDP-N-acetylglucosamine:LPS N-acetylglucosamine transferase